MCKIFKLSIFFGLSLLLTGCDAALLNPKGPVAAEQTQLLIVAVLLMLIVVVPVLILTLVFSRRYRASNTKAGYSPDWSHSMLLEAIWWAIPCVIIVILAIITWITSHSLDPYRPLDVKAEPIKIEAVALEWRWLFIYPDQHIATINQIEFPVNRPVRFYITSDAPMNSFQIPQLAGQIYAMAGMRTKLNMMATEKGVYQGYSANYSGNGFAGMRFNATATSQADFDKWVSKVKSSSKGLNIDTYNKLNDPSEDDSVQYFKLTQDDLFHRILMKYMKPNMADSKGDLVEATASNGN